MNPKILRGLRRRGAIIEQANQNSITHLIKTLKTKEEKRNLIQEKNPLLYVFGEKLVVKKLSESYEDYVSRQYIGRI